MWKSKLLGLLLSLRSLLCPCAIESEAFDNTDRPPLHRERVGRWPGLESSGLAWWNDTLWTVQDGGWPARLFALSGSGTPLDTLNLPGRNYDWEALATLPGDTLVIGDVGNNANWRRWAHFYRVGPTGLPLDTLHVQWAGMDTLAPGGWARHDAEGLAADSLGLWLVSKPRKKALTHLYRLPWQGDTLREVLPHQSLRLRSPVTGAALHPNGQQLALLAYGKVYIMVWDQHQWRPQRCYWWPGNGQAEGIVYLPDGSLVVSNEAGKLWRLTLGRQQ